MRRFIILLSAISLLIGLNACKPKVQTVSNDEAKLQNDAHTSENSLDWKGVYTGLLPCADCSGIQVTLHLGDDNYYEMAYLYVDKGEPASVFTGNFQWNESGSEITLNGIDKAQYPNRYKVGENKLFQLDMDGNMITGELADKYILEKVIVSYTNE